MLDSFYDTQKSTKIAIVAGMVIGAGMIASIACFYTDTGMRDIIEQDVFIGSLIAAGVLLAIITTVGLFLEYGFETQFKTEEYNMSFEVIIDENQKSKTFSITYPIAPGWEGGQFVQLKTETISLSATIGQKSEPIKFEKMQCSDGAKRALADQINQIIENGGNILTGSLTASHLSCDIAVSYEQPSDKHVKGSIVLTDKIYSRELKLGLCSCL